MTTPALQRLRERFPAAHIALLAPRKLAELWRGHPSINAVLSFGPSEGSWAVARRLREQRFDAALVLPNSPRSALEVWLAGIPNRIGYARAWRNWFLSRAVPARPDEVRMRKRTAREIRNLTRTSSADEKGRTEHRKENASAGLREDPASCLPPPASPTRGFRHQIYEYLYLAAVVGASPEPLPPLLITDPQEARAVRSKFGLDSQSIGSRPLLAVNPGAEYGPAKRWPANRFVAAVREIQSRTDGAWLVVGGDSDVRVAEEIHSSLQATGSEAYNLAGKTSLRELMALLKLCRVLLSNDSGPMHVAAALGTPVVVPFGSTSSELTGPGLPGVSRAHLLQAQVPCAPCFRRSCPIDFRCMTGISVEHVVAAVLEAMADGGREAGGGRSQ